MILSFRIGIFLASIVTLGLFFFALPDSGLAGSVFGGPPCCESVIPEQGTICNGGEAAVPYCNSDICLQNPGACELFEDRICVPDNGSDTFGSCQELQTNIPTLGEWGLIALVAVLGAAGYIVLRRRKVPA